MPRGYPNEGYHFFTRMAKNRYTAALLSAIACLPEFGNGSADRTAAIAIRAAGRISIDRNLRSIYFL
jgi:hypothetical protein